MEATGRGISSWRPATSSGVAPSRSHSTVEPMLRMCAFLTWASAFFIEGASL